MRRRVAQPPRTPRGRWRERSTPSAPTRPPSTSILVIVRNERNEEIARQVVNVGALQGTERRTFSLSIEVSDPKTGPALRRR